MEESTAAPRPLDEARRFGKYEILRPLASGGMAQIHLARAQGPHGFEKLVVIKRILPQFAHLPDYVDMFLEEARLAATLQHSNVVQVYEVGCVDGEHFFAMEFLHGADARQMMRASVTRGRPLPLEHAIAIVLGACAGLHYAHAKTIDGRPIDVVHRDVTPSNLFVTYDGQIKVVDFGIAKASSRESKTKFGTLKGKAGYMSPEQVRSQPLDRRSDLFALAIVLWELTTRRRLFGCDNEFDTLKAILEQDAPPPSRFVPDYPPELEAIVMKALRRPRGERYRTVEEMQLDLEAFARERKLVISPVALGRYMRGLFADVLEDWERAQREGKDLGTHLAEVGDPSFVYDDYDAPLVDPKDPASASMGPDARTLKPRALRRLARAISWSLVVGALLVAGGWIGWRARTPPAVIVVSSPAPGHDSPPVAAPPAEVAPPGEARTAAPAPVDATAHGAPADGERSAKPARSAHHKSAHHTTRSTTRHPSAPVVDPDAPLPLDQ